MTRTLIPLLLLLTGCSTQVATLDWKPPAPSLWWLQDTYKPRIYYFFGRPCCRQIYMQERVLEFEQAKRMR